MDVQERVRGCLLGGAIGDALGAPIEFQSLADILREHRGSIQGYVATWRGAKGLVTDDTQMTLFTAEALAAFRTTPPAPRFHEPQEPGAVPQGPGGGFEGYAAAVRAVRAAYLRWDDTQHHRAPPPPDRSHRTGWLREEGWLYSRRAPGNACLSGVRTPFPGPSPLGRPGPVNPASKGCGTVMRSAPFGLVAYSPLVPGPEEAFELSAACAQITHGHPTGYLAAGAFAAIVAYLMSGEALEPSVRRSMDLLAARPAHEETTAALDAALELAASGTPSAERVESLGGAWIAEEALAIGVYCALAEPDVERALLLSVNHSGDSDSTGSVCGNLLGAWHGAAALPAPWLRPLEGRETIERLATELCS
ncbi:ADP-ribosylglycohydrolase [Nonomuraea maritima]|uniref:ADP-ribosylglycohydrolase n=1 Tax=Nonomuraea maritima TaxID=683260 RepID=A0A1G9FAW5_9ACTN|nr:ADP-ribosylglycohydrolase family protein [Nonomuraea maritima]SDK85562.1 ADP-ribosylglycohydrolase [Nonomuraea maritima]